VGQLQNANCGRVTNCDFLNNRNGVRLTGSDANAWLFEACRADYNRAWGANDTSFLSNTYIGWEAAGNGITPEAAALGASVVSFGGNRYTVIDGQEVGAATNAPSGTTASNTWWYYMEAGGSSGGAIPAWSNGMPIRSGGAYRANNPNACSLFLNCYRESGQGFNQIQTPAVFIAGEGAAENGRGSGLLLYNQSGVTHVGGPTQIDGNLTVVLQVNGTTTVDGTVHAVDVIRALRTGGTAVQDQFYKPDGSLFGSITGSVANGLFLDFVNGLHLRHNGGEIANTSADSLVFQPDKGIKGFNNAAPAAGAHDAGEIVWNVGAVAGGKIGWVCVVAGTPGTWKAFGVIDP
jgi:hypothetical protein